MHQNLVSHFSANLRTKNDFFCYKIDCHVEVAIEYDLEAMTTLFENEWI